MAKKQYDWLYIIFAHESGIADGRMFDGFFNDQLKNLTQSPFNNKIKVIVLLNYPKVVRSLSQKEKRILGKPERKNLVFFETWVYESRNTNTILSMHKIAVKNYWQDAFDLVFSNFEAKQYVMHTVSHCTGHEINSTNNGFALNVSGNQINFYKAGLSSYNSKGFKITLRRIIDQKKNKYYLFAARPKTNNKRNKLFGLQKKPLKKWGRYNKTNGLLFYDFISYLKTWDIKFEFFLLNNCNILLYENAYLLNGTCNFALGSTGDINGEFVNAGLVYKTLPLICSPEQKIKQIFDCCLHTIDNKYPNQAISRHYTIINIDNLVGLSDKLKQIFYLVNKIICQSDIDRKNLKEYIDSKKGNFLKIISDDEDKPYYDILKFVNIIRDYNPLIFGTLVSEFEKELLSTKVILHNNTADGQHHYLSLCLPDLNQMKSKFTYVRNFFKSPQNLFAKEIGYDKFIFQFHL